MKMLKCVPLVLFAVTFLLLLLTFLLFFLTLMIPLIPPASMFLLPPVAMEVGQNNSSLEGSLRHMKGVQRCHIHDIPLVLATP